MPENSCHLHNQPRADQVEPGHADDGAALELGEEAQGLGVTWLSVFAGKPICFRSAWKRGFSWSGSNAEIA